MVNETLYHVRAAAPAKGAARTLRFRNRFQGYSCIFASPVENIAITEWFSRYITGKYTYIRKLHWDDQGHLIGIDISDESDMDKWLADRLAILQSALYVYTYNLDEKWNKHPTKDCYMSRSNVRYNRNVKPIALYNLIGAKLNISTRSNHDY